MTNKELIAISLNPAHYSDAEVVEATLKMSSKLGDQGVRISKKYWSQNEKTNLYLIENAEGMIVSLRRLAMDLIARRIDREIPESLYALYRTTETFGYISSVSSVRYRWQLIRKAEQA